MRNFDRQKKTRLVFLTFSVIAFCLFSFIFLPIDISFASSVDNFENFDSSLTKMLKDYDTLSDTKTYKLSEEDYKIENDDLYISANALEEYDLKIDDGNVAEDGYYSVKTVASENSISVSVENDENVTLEKYSGINRLIVYSWDDLNSYGAVAEAEYNQYHIFQYDSAECAAKAYEHFQNLEGVTNVCYDGIISSNSIEINTTYTYNSWGAEYIGYAEYTNTMLEIYDESNLENIIVAVLDSGIYAEHELFQGRLLTEYAKSYISDEGTTYDYQDKNGHGTHVSGTIAEATLSNVKILPVKILNADGKGYVSGIVGAINYVVNLKTNNGLNIKVMNMSVGVEGTSSNYPSLTNAIKNAYNNEIASVVSAGNGDEDTGIRIDVANSCPANVEEAITVAALVQKKSFPSGYTLSYDSYSNYGQYIDFAAPGTYIVSAGTYTPTSYRAMSGTSMAAPHVTACVALIYSNPSFAEYTIDEVYDLLKNNAVDLGSSGWDQDYGYGLVNISNIVIQTIGEVEFSATEKFPTSSFNLTLSYENSDNSVRIYYTTDETAEFVDSSDNLYSSPITISKTTKITAVAYVYNNNDELIQKSNLTTFTYYFDNLDLTSNYEYDTYANGVVITSYFGELTTLNVPETIGLREVIGIDQFAFKSSNVEILNLPSSVYNFYDSAFYGCTNLREIHCESDSLVSIGNYAFRDCTNLTIFDVSEIESVGQYAFASCSSLTSLELPYVETIGLHAFTRSGIESLMVGDGITTFANQTNLSLEHIYGFSETVAETFAVDNNIEFTDLTLSIEKDFTSRVIVKQNSDLNLEITYSGYNVSSRISFSGLSSNISSSSESVSKYQTNLNIKLSDLPVEEYSLFVTFTDAFSNTVRSNTIYIEVVNDTSTTFSVNFEEGNFDVLIDGEVVKPSTLFFTGFEYEIEIAAHDGYNLRKVVINGDEKSVNQTITMVVDRDLNIEVQTVEKSQLSVVFNTHDCGNVVIENNLVNNTVISRNEGVAFSIEEKEGYKVVRVVANDTLLIPDENDIYYIDNITADIDVDITFEEAYYSLTVSLGKGGSLSTSGGDIESVAHGSSRTFIISPSEGYDIDTVSVNGEIISISNNKFTLDDISEDYDIVVSFKKTGSVFANDNVVLNYFFIMLGLFVVFVIANITLHFVRKEKNL